MTDTITVPQDVPTKTDPDRPVVTFTFLGWSTDPNATEPQYVIPPPGTPDDQLQNNEKITLECGNDGYKDITLYAVWQEN